MTSPTSPATSARGSSDDGSQPLVITPKQSRWFFNPLALSRRSASRRNVQEVVHQASSYQPGDTEFFASLEDSDKRLAFFDRNEIEASVLLGRQGSFGQVQAVTAICCRESNHVETNGYSSSSSSSSSKSSLKRWELQASVVDQRFQEPRYCIKTIRDDILNGDNSTNSNNSLLTKAARELVNDAKILAKLGAGDGGPASIRKMHGMAKDAFGRNYLAHSYRDFFLILDMAAKDTLQDRIYQQWHCSHDRHEEPDEDLIPLKANYAFQIAKALRYCHSQGVLYRDLKPSNIGFSRSDPNVVQLLEFGLAREFPPPLSSSTRLEQQHGKLFREDAAYHMTLAGTRRYLDPHVLTTGQYSWKSAVYSWAMVYYEMCVEHKPYQGLSAQHHQSLICEQGRRPALCECYLPEALDDILSMAWHCDLSTRWTMEEVCDQMQDFLMHMEVEMYDHHDEDFLFDVEITPDPLMSNKEIDDEEGDEEDWIFLGTKTYNRQHRRAISVQNVHAEEIVLIDDDQDDALMTTTKTTNYLDGNHTLSKTSFDLAGISSSGTSGEARQAQHPCKIISSAA